MHPDGEGGKDDGNTSSGSGSGSGSDEDEGGALVTSSVATTEVGDEAVQVEVEERAASFGPAHSTKCDRRLSRAAREVIRGEVVPILRSYLDAHPRKGEVEDEYAIYRESDGCYSEEDRLLIGAIDDSRSGPGAPPPSHHYCPLDPRLDVLHHHEYHASIEKYGAGGRRTLHVCGMCRKKFVTRFYLDRHMDRRHSHQFSRQEEEGNVEESSKAEVDREEQRSWVCPAREVCPAIGPDHLGGRCIDVASDVEPGYHRGDPDRAGDPDAVGGTGGEAVNKRPPCSESDMVNARVRCEEVMRSCFGGGASGHRDGEYEASARQSLADSLVSKFCHTLTCHHHLHKLVTASSGTANDDQRHENPHAVGAWGYVLICVLVVFYVIMFLRHCSRPTFGGGGKTSAKTSWRGRTSSRRPLSNFNGAPSNHHRSTMAGLAGKPGIKTTMERRTGMGIGTTTAKDKSN